MAVIQFESLGVQANGQLGPFSPNARNILRINGVDIPGGITAGPTNVWSRDGGGRAEARPTLGDGAGLM